MESSFIAPRDTFIVPPFTEKPFYLSPNITGTAIGGEFSSPRSAVKGYSQLLQRPIQPAPVEVVRLYATVAEAVLRTRWNKPKIFFCKRGLD